MREREPHAVPRGLLRFYILRLLTDRPMKGYEVITKIENRTEGVWKPGPGSIYPMLESLKKEGLIQAASVQKKGTAQKRGTTLQITENGKEALSKFRRNIKSRMHMQTRNIYRIWADLVYPGMELDDIILAERRRDIERIRHVLDDDYWNTVSAEKKRKFLEGIMKILQEELDLIRKELSVFK